MQAWHFSETAYPYLPPVEGYNSIRVTLPNKHYDPEKGAALWDRYLDEWCIADDEGVEVMLNEHHQTATCVDPAAPLLLAALARLTKRARLLILGNPIANRRQPVRVAEEMALADVLSRGRVEVGFVRGVPWEVAAANSNPVRMNERHWEALDLILKAWTAHEGPVSHEGRFFHHRNINIWPRPYQQPHPPDMGQHHEPERRGTCRRPRIYSGNFLDRLRRYARSFRRLSQGLASSRPRRHRATRPPRLCGARLHGAERGRGAGGRRETSLVHHGEQGSSSAHISARLRAVRAAVDVMRGKVNPLSHFGEKPTVESAIESGIMMAGTPDQVVKQVRKLHDHVGGFGHLAVDGAGWVPRAQGNGARYQDFRSRSVSATERVSRSTAPRRTRDGMP